MQSKFKSDKMAFLIVQKRLEKNCNRISCRLQYALKENWRFCAVWIPQNVQIVILWYRLL